MELSLSEILIGTMGNDRVEQSLMRQFGICFGVAKELRMQAKLSVTITFTPDEDDHVAMETSIKRETPEKEELKKAFLELEKVH